MHHFFQNVLQKTVLKNNLSKKKVKYSRKILYVVDK